MRRHNEMNTRLHPIFSIVYRATERRTSVIRDISICLLLTTLFVSTANAEAENKLAAERAHEVQVNTFTASSQSEAVVTETSDGGFVVAWHSRRQQEGSYGIYLQRFAADGKAVGTETQVNLHTKSMQMHPALATDSEGGVWVAWESFGQDGSFNAIIARRFAGDDFIGGNEVLVNQHVEGNQGQVVAASHADSSVTFFWVTQDDDAVKHHIAARRFDSLGQPLSDEYIPAPSQQHQSNPAVASRDGKMVLVWAERDEYGRPANLFGRQISSQLNTHKKLFAVNVDDQAHHIEPSVSVNDDGSFVVAWLRSQEHEYEVFTRKFDGLSNAVNNPVQISPAGASYVNGAAVESLSDNQVLVCWNQQTDKFGKDRNVLGRIIDVESFSLGSTEQINKNQAGQHLLSAASGKRLMHYDRELEQLRIVWSGASDSDKSSVNVTAFVPNAQTFAFSKAPVNAEPANEVTAKPHEPPVFDAKMISKDPFGGFKAFGPTGGTDFGFVAINATGWNPPDPDIAVGPDHIVAMTNGAIAFFDKSGTLMFSDQIEGADGFWGAEGATAFVFDPETLFDPHSQRFFAMANERGSDGRSYFLLAVSDDDDPNGNWFRYRLDVTDLADNNIDSPNMAVDQDTVYLTADFFGPDRYLVFMLRKSDLLVGAEPDTTDLLITGSQSYGLPLIYDVDAPAFYMLQAFEFGNFNQIRVHGITDSLTNPQRVTTDVTVPSYGNPVNPPQMGTSVRPELFEARFWSCVYRDGSLWAVHHHSPGSTGMARVRWYEIAMNDWPASGQLPQLVQSGELTPTNDSGTPSATFFPSIWVDADGNAAITTARSSNTEFISMSRALRSASDPLGTFQEVQLVQPSTSFFTTNGRWGDYSDTYSDPIEPEIFWGIHEFAQADGVWQTFIARYQFEEIPTSISPSSASASPGKVSGGDFDDLDVSDDSYLTVLAGLPDVANGEEVAVTITANSVDTDFGSMNFIVESSINTPNVNQKIELFNFLTNEFESIDEGNAELSDNIVNVAVTGDATRFVTPGSGLLIARISFESNGPTLFFPWEVRLDQVQWQIFE